jgi:aspartate/methionine/tyrosine aminotransferase
LSSSALSSRRHLFHKTINSVPGWSVASSGGFFAYVSYPLEYITAGTVIGKKRKLGSEDVARELASRVGVLTLPGAFFMPDLGSPVWEGLNGGEQLQEDRWLR